MLENLITPEFLAKQEGISVEEARAALAANTKLNQELDDTLQKSISDDSPNSDDSAKQITNLVNGFIANLTGKTPAELNQESQDKQGE